MGSRFSPRSTLQKTPAVCEKTAPKGSRPAPSVVAGRLPGLITLWYTIPETPGFFSGGHVAAQQLRQNDPNINVWAADAVIDGVAVEWTAGYEPTTNAVFVSLFAVGNPLPILYTPPLFYAGPWPQFDTHTLDMQTTVVALPRAATARLTI